MLLLDLADLSIDDVGLLLLLLDLADLYIDDVGLLLALTDLTIESSSALASGRRLVSSPRRAAFAPVAATSKIEIAAETFMMMM